MPYIIISTQIRLECGPTIVGDEWSDKELMDYLGASLEKALGNNFLEYKSPDPPRIILNKLERRDYKLVSSTGIGQTCLWTLHKPDIVSTNVSIANTDKCVDMICSAKGLDDDDFNP